MKLFGPSDDALLRFIDAYWDEYWTSPSYNTICKHFGIPSRETVNRWLYRLVREGKLEARQQPNPNRSVLFRVKR